MQLNTPAEIIDDIRNGKMVILMDDEDRENEGDLVMAADYVTPDAINFMATYGRGLICLTLTRDRCKQLNLQLMVDKNKSQFATAFTASIEAAEGVTTGISAADRARTVKAAVARDAKASDIVQPGHIFPLMAQDGGVLVRQLAMIHLINTPIPPRLYLQASRCRYRQPPGWHWRPCGQVQWRFPWQPPAWARPWP